MKRKYTPEKITKLKDNEVFVFGSNTQGRHGAGAAKLALDKFGAIYGQPHGLQGSSYAIITTDLEKRFNTKEGFPNFYEEKYGVVNYNLIATQIAILMATARSSTNITYYMTKIGCGLAGYEIQDTANIFKILNNGAWGPIPDNIILPKEFECRK